MARAATILLENTSEVPQQIFHEGERYSIPDHGMAEFPAKVAQEFIEQRGRWVREYENVPVPPPGPSERIVYVANVTGNPFLDPEVTETRITRGKEEVYTIPNPLRQAKVIRYKKQGGQIVQPCPKDPQSEESINLPPSYIVMPPYRRVRMGHVLAEWLILRDLQQPSAYVGGIRYARAPASFEPNHAWELDEMRLYAETVDSRTFVRDHPVWGDVLGPSTKELETDEEVRDATTALWRKLFFRVIDERYGMMSEHDWKIFRKRRLEKIAHDEAKKQRREERRAGKITEALQGAAT